MADPIAVTRTIFIDPGEVEESFIRASGPGGQNVNKVASAVQLRFNLLNSPSIPEPMKRRVAALAGSRLTREGVIVLTSDSHRSQAQNREAALARLLALLREGASAPRKRVPTRPTLASKRRRVEGKARRGTIKQLRRGPGAED